MVVDDGAVVEEAVKSASVFTGFDIFMIAFTIILAIAVYRLAKQKQRNLFALGFTSFCFVTFLGIDFLMVLHWTGQLRKFQDMLFG